MSDYQQYLMACHTCGKRTSKAYARKHNNQCKCCAEGVERPSRSERENALLIDSGYAAYAAERGDYDLPEGY